jgi:hypothetical protein
VPVALACPAWIGAGGRSAVEANPRGKELPMTTVFAFFLIAVVAAFIVTGGLVYFFSRHSH